jgi:hypothetical protein
VFVDKVAQLQPPAVGGLVELEVDRPYLVRPVGPQPLGDLRRDPAALPGSDRPAQAFLAPQPPDPLVVDVRLWAVGFAAQQPVRHPPAPPRMLAGDVAEPCTQPLLLVRAPWRG